jgi:23S rRNA pseudouridine1911/1915/1917 synthase
VPTLTVPQGVTPARLDVFLAHQVPDCSRRTAQRAIAAGQVRINGRPARKGHTIAGGDIILVPDELYQLAIPPANPHLRVHVLYEDAAVIVVDKPPGMPSHALRPDQTATMANFLLARYPELAAVGKSPLEPGIVHRLDTDTSGVLLAARTVAAYENLRRQFAAHTIRKEYIALVDGDVARAGELRTSIAHNRRDRRTMRVCSPSEKGADARPAITRYRPIERFGNHTLLAVQIRTGVMHQIRAHLASMGHPVTGDRLYGKRPDREAHDAREHRGMPALARRQFLHACGLGFAHPQTGQPMHISSPLPMDCRRILAALREVPRASRAASPPPRDRR